MKECGEKFTKEDLFNKYVRVPNEIIKGVVEKMFLDAGYEWMYSNAGKDFNYTPESYIRVHYENKLVQSDSFTDMGKNMSPISIITLAEILSEPDKPTHTLMTEEELKERYKESDGLEGALKLSIEKWERLLKDENWDALSDSFHSGGESTFVGTTTCALCRLCHCGACTDCPLVTCGDGSTYNRAHAALYRGDKTDFSFQADKLLKKMEYALEELKKPKKLYRIGDHFANSGNLYVLAASGIKAQLINMREGSYWSEPIEVESLHSITEKEMSTIHRFNSLEQVEVMVAREKGGGKK